MNVPEYSLARCLSKSPQGRTKDREAMKEKQGEFRIAESSGRGSKHLAPQAGAVAATAV